MGFVRTIKRQPHRAVTKAEVNSGTIDGESGWFSRKRDGGQPDVVLHLEPLQMRRETAKDKVSNVVSRFRVHPKWLFRVGGRRGGRTSAWSGRDRTNGSGPWRRARCRGRCRRGRWWRWFRLG